MRGRKGKMGEKNGSSVSKSLHLNYFARQISYSMKVISAQTVWAEYRGLLEAGLHWNYIECLLRMVAKQI